MDIIETSFGRKDSELQNWTYNIPEGYEAIIEGNKVIVRKKGPIFTPFEQKLKEIVDDCVNYGGTLTDKGVIDYSNQLLTLARKEFEEELKDKQELSSEVIKKVEKDAYEKGRADIKKELPSEETICNSKKKGIEKKHPNPFETFETEFIAMITSDYIRGLDEEQIKEMSNKLFRLAEKEIIDGKKCMTNEELESMKMKMYNQGQEDERENFLKENITEDMISGEVASRLQKCGWYVRERNELPVWKKIPLGFVSYQHHMEPTIVGLDEIVYKGYMLDKNEFSKLKNLPFDY